MPIIKSCRVFSFALFLLFSFSGLLAAEIRPEDAKLLEKIEKDSLQYFIRLSDKVSGLTRDSSRTGSPASIAATGFALAAVAIGADRGWIPQEAAKSQLRKTLRTLLTRAAHERGFFYHFLDPHSGRRIWSSEASSIDTALLVAGALVAGQYYPGTDIAEMARRLYERIDWRGMMNDSEFICMGWKPETGFLPYYWTSYSELMILQAFAIGSPTHPVPPEAWQRWARPQGKHNGKNIVYSWTGSLFTYQFAQAYIDFRNLSDKGINYFENSRLATIANREYSSSFKEQYITYADGSWGLSASLGAGGYKSYGAKPGEGFHDGTIAPYAAVAAIVFTPEDALRAIRIFYERWETLYGIFGFKDAFNRDKQWWAEEYLGIDQGISVLMLENFLNDGVVWKKTMRLEAIQRWIRLCNLRNSSSMVDPNAHSAIPSS